MEKPAIEKCESYPTGCTTWEFADLNCELRLAPNCKLKISEKMPSSCQQQLLFHKRVLYGGCTGIWNDKVGTLLSVHSYYFLYFLFFWIIMKICASKSWKQTTLIARTSLKSVFISIRPQKMASASDFYSTDCYVFKRSRLIAFV